MSFNTCISEMELKSQFFFDIGTRLLVGSQIVIFHRTLFCRIYKLSYVFLSSPDLLVEEFDWRRIAAIGELEIFKMASKMAARMSKYDM